MRRWLLVIPDLLSPEGSEGFIPSRGAFSRLYDHAEIVRIAPALHQTLPEQDLLGLAPSTLAMAQGPLTVASLGYDPPDRSVHFHVTPLSLDEENRLQSPGSLPTDVANEVLSLAKQLDTRALTLLAGYDADHGLVWENGSIELGLKPSFEALGQPMSSVLPEGDGEVLLRRFIDDSVNLLFERDFNRRRIDEGKPPINVLWPWGAGYRTPVPNLALRRGWVAQFFSTSIRLAGLVRLVGYGHSTLGSAGTVLRPNIGGMAQHFAMHQQAIAAFNVFSEVQTANRPDHGERVLALLEDAIATYVWEKGLELVIAAPGSEGRSGLALIFNRENLTGTSIPMHERALDDRKLPQFHLWELASRVLDSSIEESSATSR